MNSFYFDMLELFNSHPVMITMAGMMSIWCIAVGWSSLNFKKAISKNTLSLEFFILVTGMVMTVCSFMQLIYVALDISTGCGLVVIAYVCQILAISSFITGIRNRQIKARSSIPKEISDDKFRGDVLKAIDDCVKYTFSDPYFKIIREGGVDGCTIFMNTGALCGVINYNDPTIKPKVVRVGSICVSSNEDQAPPQDLAYICAMNIRGLACDVVLCYANGFDHMSVNAIMVKMIRYRLLDTMKRDPVLVKVILN